MKMKAYRNSVCIIAFVAMLLAFLAGALVMVYHVFSNSDAPYPIILDALYECIPALIIFAGILLLIYLFVFITFRMLFSTSIRMEMQKMRENQHETKSGSRKEKPVPAETKAEEIPEENVPVQETEVTEADAPAERAANPIDNGTIQKQKVASVQDNNKNPAKEEVTLSREEQEMLHVLQNALKKGNVAEGCYSIGEFQPGKVSLFKGAGGAWRVSKPQDIGPQLARGYKDLKKATLEFTRLVSMIRVV